MTREASRARRPRGDLASSRFTDAGEMAARLPPAEGRAAFLQTSGGRPFSGSVIRLPLAGVDLVIGKLDVPTVSQGAPAADRIVVVAPLDAPGPCRWNGHTIGTDTPLAFGPGTEHHGVNPPRLRFALLSVSARAFASFVAALTGREEEQHWTRAGVRTVERAGAAALCGRLRRVVAEAERDLTLLRAGAARRAARHALLADLARALEGPATRVRCAEARGFDRSRVLRRVESYLEQQLAKPIYLTELCSAAGVGERSLEKVFREIYGISPIRYLKLRRLHAVRSALCREEPADRTVTQVAVGLGFFHLGHFSADYAALFGEPPSETLRRNAR